MLRTLLVASLVAAPAFAFEVRTDSEGDVVRWNRKVEFVIAPELSKALGVPGAENAVTAAVQAVAAKTPNLQLTVKQGEREPKLGYVLGGSNQNDIVYLADWPYEGKALAATLVTLNARTNEMLDTDIAINGESAGFRIFEGSVSAEETRYDLQNTLTHEVGHALGLMHNMSDERTVMFPSAAPGETSKRTLAADDIAGLVELYGKYEPQPEPLLPGVGCSASPSSAPIGFMTLMVLLALRRRARLAAAVVAVSAAAAVAAEPVVNDGRAEPEEIAWGEVVNANARWMPETKVIVTEVEVEVQRCVKGVCADRRVKLSVLGGRVGDIEQVVAHQPAVKRGSQVVLTRRSGHLKMVVAR